MLEQERLMDVIIRTKNSAELLEACLQSICDEIPVRRIIIVDGGSTDKTLEIASKFNRVSIYSLPDLNLGQATKYGFLMAKTEWVAVIDSDIILRKGWFEEMKKHMSDADAVEGCRNDYYTFKVSMDCTKAIHGRFGQTILKREPVLNMDLDLPFGEDTVVKLNFERQGMKWKRSGNFLADHYTKIEGSKHRRTGTIFDPDPRIVHIPKKFQIEQGRIVRKYCIMTRRQVIKRLILPPIYEAYWTFKKNLWFVLAYFKLIS
jgi:glycosyltransferase involved in cell wall biosynthesis